MVALLKTSANIPAISTTFEPAPIKAAETVTEPSVTGFIKDSFDRNPVKTVGYGIAAVAMGVAVVAELPLIALGALVLGGASGCATVEQKIIDHAIDKVGGGRSPG